MMKTDDEIEARIQELQLNAPRISPEHILNKIKGKTFTVLPSGKCMVCEITLENGFTVRGEASTVSKANFNQEIGEEVSYKKAFEQIWVLEGYLLQQKLYEAALKQD